MSTAGIILLGLGSFYGGFALCGILTSGKIADEKAAAFRAGRMVGRVMGAIETAAKPPMDDGARLLGEITEEAERAALWAEMGAPRS